MAISDETWRALILSVGTHRGKRPFSPKEVAETLRDAIEAGLTLDGLRRRLHLDGTGMLGKFLGLLNLVPELRDLVDWGRKPGALSMTAAAEIARLPPADQLIVAGASLRENLSKEQVREIINLRLTTKFDANASVEKVLARRPTVTKKYVFVGMILDDALKAILLRMSQAQRDDVMRAVIGKLTPNVASVGVKLGNARFSLVGDKAFSETISKLAPNFEQAIGHLIAQELQHYG